MGLICIAALVGSGMDGVGALAAPPPPPPLDLPVVVTKWDGSSYFEHSFLQTPRYKQNSRKLALHMSISLQFGSGICILCLYTFRVICFMIPMAAGSSGLLNVIVLIHAPNDAWCVSTVITTGRALITWLALQLWFPRIILSMFNWARLIQFHGSPSTSCSANDPWRANMLMCTYRYEMCAEGR